MHAPVTTEAGLTYEAAQLAEYIRRSGPVEPSTR